MKKLIALALFVGSSVFVKAQQTADDLIGKYMTAENKALIEISKRDNKYFGKFLWTKTEGKLDEKNPVVAERTKPLKGLELLKNFSYDGKNTWNNGTIYDPENGKTYSCKITRDEKGNLSVRGYIGVSLIGRTSEWVKVK